MVRTIVLLSVLLGLFLGGAWLAAWPLDGRAQATHQRQGAAEGAPTRVVVLVIARGGKFVGDDAGGALVTIRDLQTGELLASGRTQGGSGLPDLPTVETTRLEEIPDEDAARFETTLLLAEPRLVEIAAYGPLAAQGSAGRATTTRWLLPSDANMPGNRVVLTLDGLVVQILAPPTHFLPTTPAPLRINFRANVTMMCGCPIGPRFPWRPEEYRVWATIRGPAGVSDRIALDYDAAAPDDAPSQFVGSWVAPAAGVYEAVVTAYQAVHDNAGASRVTFVVP